MESYVSIQSYRIWCAAVDARDRAAEKVRNNPHYMPFDAMVAVVLAAAAAEAFINEVATALEVERRSVYGTSRMPAVMLALADALDDVEDSHGSLTLKYIVAGHVVGRPYDRGTNPFQDFATLVRLRNDSMHLKHRDRLVTPDQEHTTGLLEWPKYVSELQRRGLARRVDDPNMVMTSFDALQTPELATWAYTTADQMMRSLLTQLPSGVRSPVYVLHRAFKSS